MEEETIGQRLRRLRLAAGLSIRAFAKRSGVDREHIYQIEGDKVKSITLRTAQRLAKGLDKPASVFFGEPPETTATLKKSIADLAELSINAYIPVYAEVSAGEGIEPIDYIACTRKEPAPETLRAYRVKGLCLEDEIRDGDTLIVDTAQSPLNGNLVVVFIDGQVSVKRYREDGQGRKWLENNTGQYRPEDCRLHGVVLELERRLK